MLFLKPETCTKGRAMRLYDTDWWYWFPPPAIAQQVIGESVKVQMM